MLHFGEEPKWNPNCKFIIVDYDEKENVFIKSEKKKKSGIFIKGEISDVVQQLTNVVKMNNYKISLESSWVKSILENKKVCFFLFVNI